MRDRETAWMLYVSWEHNKFVVNLYKDKPTRKQIDDSVRNVYEYTVKSRCELIEDIFDGERVDFIHEESGQPDTYWIQEMKLK